MWKSAGDRRPTFFKIAPFWNSVQNWNKLLRKELSDNTFVSVENIQTKIINRSLFECRIPSILREEYYDRFPEF